MRVFSIRRIKKPIKLRFYTDNPGAAELFPPVKASQCLPEWVKTAPKGTPFEVSVKNCVGLRSYFARSIILPLWSDFRYTLSDTNMNWEFSDHRSEFFVEREFGVMQRPSYALCKFMSPWAAECATDVNFVQSQNLWDERSFSTKQLNAVVDFKYQHATHVFSYFPIEDAGVLIAGTPLAVYTPLADAPVVVTAEYDPEKYARLMLPGKNRAFFQNWYARYRQARIGKGT